MKTTTTLLTSCLLVILSNSASAMDIRGERTSFYERNKPKSIGLNYTYLEVGYLNSTVESNNANDDKVQSIDAEVSFAISPEVSGSLEITGSAYNFNNNFVKSTEIIAGAQYHYSISTSADIFSAFKLISISLEDPNSNQSVSASGRSISLGLRHQFTPNMEWGFSMSRVEIEDDQYTNSRIGFAYGSDDELQYLAGFESTNSDNKKTSFSLGIRFNYD